MKSKMAAGFSYTTSLILPFLFLLMLGQGNSVEDHLHHHQQQQEVESAQLGIFTIEDVEAMNTGQKLPIYFPIRDPSLYAPAFLPKRVADTIPFSSSHVSNILSRFSLSSDSPKANAVRETLTKCELPTTEGEIKICATSMESLLDFLTKRFGPETDFKFITTSHPTLVTEILQNYTVLDRPREVRSGKKAACHPNPYVYAVYFCHYDASETRAYMVPLIGDESGDRVDALIVCHMDTSKWTSAHISFKLLGTKPGDPMCHVFAQGNMIWIHHSDSDSDTVPFMAAAAAV